MPVRALVGRRRLFGISENTVRVALARLLADGLVERDERGCVPARRRAPQAVSRQVASWRALDAAHAALDRRLDRRAHGRASAASRAPSCVGATRALDCLGFRALAPGLAVRPDNLAGGVDGVRDGGSTRLGLERRGARVRAARASTPRPPRRARRLWDADGARRRLPPRPRCARAQRARPRSPARAAAMVESFRARRRGAIRQLALDPLLPEPIVPAAEREALVAAMRRYDRARPRLLGALPARPRRPPHPRRARRRSRLPRSRGSDA